MKRLANGWFLCSTLICLFMLAAGAPAAWAQQYQDAKLIASDGDELDRFGTSVSISGDVALVGADGDDDNGEDSGSAYVFRYDSESEAWIEEAKLLASDGFERDSFGSSVSVSGDVALVGADQDDDNGLLSGSAYVFRYDSGTGTWIEEAKLLASDAGEWDQFGISVTVSGDVALVGALFGDNNGIATGSAYVFRYDPGSGTWIEEEELLASDGEDDDYFSYSVAISGNAALVGARQDDDNGNDSGSAYVFRYDSGTGTWIEEGKLLANDGADDDLFGFSVALSGNVALVGARNDADNGLDSGSAYVFRYDPGIEMWIQEDKLLASDGADDDEFGNSVSLSGDLALVGAHEDDDRTGSAYLFRYDHDSRTWNEEAKLLASDGEADDLVGESVAISGGLALVGAIGEEGGGSWCGSAYVFGVDIMLSAPFPNPLVGGKDFVISLSRSEVNTHTLLIYGLDGAGSIPVPPLRITIGLINPKPAGPVRMTDSDGKVLWVFRVPMTMRGSDIWFQALQYGHASNVVATSIL